MCWQAGVGVVQENSRGVGVLEQGRMSYQCQGLGTGSATSHWEQHLVALGHDRRDALCPGTLLLLCLGTIRMGLS